MEPLALVVFIIAGRPGLRLHQRLPRRGQLHRHRRLHPGAHAPCRRWSGRRSSTSWRPSASACRWRSTIGKGVVRRRSAWTHWVILAALIGAITWNLITWYCGIPSSSSHALIGGLAGAAVAQGGLGSAGACRAGQDRRSSSSCRRCSASSSAFALMVAVLWIFRRASPGPGRPALPPAPARLGRLLQPGARHQRRAEDDGDHRGAPVRHGSPRAGVLRFRSG